MKNTLSDLNNYLFEAIERINDDSLKDNELDREIRKSKTIVAISNTIISNANLMLNAKKTSLEYNCDKDIIRIGD